MMNNGKKKKRNRKKPQTGTHFNCDDARMRRKEMRGEKNRYRECRRRKWGGKRKRTLPAAAAAGGPNGEMGKR